MAKKEEKKQELAHIKAPISALSPVYTNVIALFSHEEVVMLDFGMCAPSYCEPHEMEDAQLARVILSWEGAEGLFGMLKSAISAHKKEERTERNTKKDKGGLGG